MRALNSGGETFQGIDYTVAGTRFDEFLTPPEEVTTIEGAVNIALQDICPANTSEQVYAKFSEQLLLYPHVTDEPPLRRYAANAAG